MAYGWIGWLVAGVMLVASPALANDTQAVEGAGGLRLAKNAALRMESEDLRLGRDEVRVAYVFRNLSPHDQTITVAFPLPALDMGDLSETPHSFHFNGRDGDVVDFHLEVDGRPAAPKLDVHAINAAGRDITAALRAAGVPMVGARSDDEIERALGRLTAAQVKTLAAVDAVDADEWMPPNDVHHPKWRVRASYYWTQRFPAGGVVRIGHRYRPVLGAVPVRDLDLAKLPSELGGLGTWPDEKKGWCLTRADLRPYARSGAVLAWLEYVLKTGANWAGPIGQFRLTIAAPPGGIASACPIPGLTLTRSRAGLAADAINFTPTSDIAAAFAAPVW
jgi:hypothetical protein